MLFFFLTKTIWVKSWKSSFFMLLHCIITYKFTVKRPKVKNKNTQLLHTYISSSNYYFFWTITPNHRQIEFCNMFLRKILLVRKNNDTNLLTWEKIQSHIIFQIASVCLQEYQKVVYGYILSLKSNENGKFYETITVEVHLNV